MQEETTSTSSTSSTSRTSNTSSTSGTKINTCNMSTGTMEGKCYRCKMINNLRMRMENQY